MVSGATERMSPLDPQMTSNQNLWCGTLGARQVGQALDRRGLYNPPILYFPGLPAGTPYHGPIHGQETRSTILSNGTRRPVGFPDRCTSAVGSTRHDATTRWWTRWGPDSTPAWTCPKSRLDLNRFVTGLGRSPDWTCLDCRLDFTEVSARPLDRAAGKSAATAWHMSAGHRSQPPEWAMRGDETPGHDGCASRRSLYSGVWKMLERRSERRLPWRMVRSLSCGIGA